MLKGFRIRIFPTPEQEILINKHIGHCRWLWNYMLDYSQKYYQEHKCGMSRFKMMNHLTTLKHDPKYVWLNEVATASLQRICTDLYGAYKYFYSGIHKYPKYKSKKRSQKSYPVRSDRLWFDDTYAHVTVVGNVKYQTNLAIPIGRFNKFYNPRIIKDGEKWILSVSIECENQAYTLTDTVMGIDLGIKELAVVSFGNSTLVFHNINKTKVVKELENKLSHLQRVVARKYEVGNKLHPDLQWQKTNAILYYEHQISKVYSRLSHIRLNYLHQTTHTLVSMLPKAIGIETLNVSGMMKNKHLSHEIQKQRFYEFNRQMEYKCLDRGIRLIKADMFYPSSKTCSNCGHIKKDLKLSERTYVCPECGMVLDRDLNAARNLANYASSHLEQHSSGTL